jgi:MFS family permease
MRVGTATTPSSSRGPGADAHWIQGALLSSIQGLFVMTVVAVVPMIPKLHSVFANSPNARVLVPMAVALPILTMAFSSIAAGMIGERIGRRRLLEIGTAVFAVTAILPFWLSSLSLILLARAATGVALGAMMTCGVGLTGDYFAGAARQRWLAIQSGVGAAAGIVTSAISGVLVDLNWHLPFLLLGVGFPLFLALLLFPANHAATPQTQHKQEAAETGAGGPIPLAAVTAIFALGIIGSLIVMPPAYELGLVIQEKRLGEATLTGFATAVLSAGAVAGALGLGILRRLSAPAKMAVTFAAGGAGTLIISFSGQVAPVMVGAAAVGVAQGIIAPILSVWLLEQTPALKRGRVVGFYTSAFFSAQFAAPLIAGLIAAHSLSTSSSMVFYAAASVVAAALTFALSIRRPGLLAQPSI